MSLEAGRLRHRVAIERFSSTQDPITGAITESWTEIAKVWAAVEPLSAREFVQSAAGQSEVTTRITIRARDILATDRIIHRGTVYNIRGVLADRDSGLEYITLPVGTGVNEG
ncbi:phage head closure protein [Achromobacter ruhlandii]|uniref:phage head closure protein n=1 Tax=Achromobacter ruhlandii TaxID=72557 RepID=UPI000C2651B2|nr:phage head closure protein [Achromobacter ruhlandii]PJM66652.1 head-tail adaptor protein [Achromobacter ruhlandii]